MKNNKSQIKIPFELLNADKKEKYEIGTTKICINDTTIYVYSMLAGIKPDNKGLITVKQETLANKCGISVREVIKQISLLKHIKLIQSFATYQDNGYKGYNKYKLSYPTNQFTFIDRTMLENKNLSYNAKILYVRLKKGINSNKTNGEPFRFHNRYVTLINDILNKAYDKRTLERLLNELNENKYINYLPSRGNCEIKLSYESIDIIKEYINEIETKSLISWSNLHVIEYETLKTKVTTSLKKEFINWSDINVENNKTGKYETFEDWCEEKIL